MAKTNFAALTAHEKKVWSLQFWKMARNASFINQFAGTGENAMVQRVTELTKSTKGDRAVMTLINDMIGDGVAGDTRLEDAEEALTSDEDVIKIDQLRNANRTTGRMAEQKTIVRFREQSRDKLAYWMADRIDQLAFLTLSGIAYTQTLRGAARAGGTFAALSYAADVAAPSANRHLVLNSGSLLSVAGGGTTTAITANDTIGYKALVQAKAYAKEQYMRGVKGANGEEVFHVFVTPTGMARLKLDSDFLANVRSAGIRGDGNILFKGANSVQLDGMIVHEHRHVYTNEKAAPDARFGAGGLITGQRVLICGAQALGMADIGDAEWVEDDFDYENELGISVAKIFGFKKPKYKSIYSATPNVKEDFGVIAFDTAL